MSAPVLVAPGRQSDDPSGDPAVEAAHLRRLIEGQPTCLMRVDAESRLLAANGAALGLLGATLLGEALGRSLPEHITPEHQGRWRDFAARVHAGVPASVECDLTDFTGIDRAVLFQGVPLLDHHDGVPSMLLAARDISASRNLEQVLVEREVEIEIDAAIEEQQRVEQMQQEADVARVEQERLAALLAEHESQRARLIERHAAEQAHLRQTLAEEHQLAVLILERDARIRVETANKELEQAHAEQQRLMALVEGAEGARQWLESELARRESDTNGLASDRDAAQLRLREALAAEKERAAEAERQLAATISRLESEQARATETLANERTAAVERLEQELAAAASARSSVETALERASEERERVRAEISAREQVVQGQFEALQSENRDWQRQLEERQADIARLTRELADERQTARSSAEQQVGREVLQQALDEARLESERLRSVLGQQDAERQRLAQVHAQAIDTLRATLVEEKELAVLMKEREARQKIDEAEAGLARALEERQRLRTVLQESEVERERLLAEQAAHRIETEQALAAAALAKERLTKVFADQQVELQAVVGNSRTLEAAAAAGRVAREVGRELQEAAASVDRRAQLLLQQTAVAAGERQEIEALRVDAVAIASLARQLVQPPREPAGDTRDLEQTPGAESSDRSD